MPRSVDPGSITTGTGLAAEDSVEANALVHPTGGNDGLRAHILDPSRAHMAAAIGIVDAGGYYLSDEVEGALQEVGGGTAAGRSNGLIAGGTWGSAGLIVTLNATTVLLSGLQVDFTGASVPLLDNTAGQWVYIDSGTSTLMSALAPPPLSADHVLIARIDTAGGVVTTWRDARFFVKDIDRKLSYTVRNDGADADRNAEAAFESLDAAMLYIETYDGAQSQKTTIIVRGVETLSAVVTFPAHDITIKGDGYAAFLTGVAMAPMFDLNGRRRIQFKDIMFLCDHGGSTVVSDVAGGAQDFLMDRCAILSNGANWWRGIDLDNAVMTRRTVVKHTRIDADDYGYRNTRPYDDRVIDCDVSCTVGTAGTAGIALGDPALIPGSNMGRANVRGCHVDGFSVGLYVKGYACSTQGNKTLNAITGVVLDGTLCIVDDTFVRLDTTSGLIGIDVLGGTRHKIRGSVLENTRDPTSYGVAIPIGIILRSVIRSTIEDSLIDTFESTTTTGLGIYVEGTSTQIEVVGAVVTSTSRPIETDPGTSFVSFSDVQSNGGIDAALVQGDYTKVLGCSFKVLNASAVGIVGVSWTGNSGVFANNILQGTVETGIDISGDTCKVHGNTIEVDVTDGLNGVQVSGAGCQVHDNHIVNPRLVWGASLDFPKGISVTGANCSMEGNHIVGFLNSNSPRGYGIHVQNGGSGAKAHDNTVDSSDYGIYVDNAEDVEVEGNKFFDTAIPGSAARGVVVTGNALQASRNFVISGNTFAGVYEYGVYISGDAVHGIVKGNIIDGYLPANPYDPEATGIRIRSGGLGTEARYITVEGNNIQRCKAGILLEGDSAANRIRDIVVTDNLVHHCAQADPAIGEEFAFNSKGIGVWLGKDITISSNHIYAIGRIINDGGAPGQPTLGGPEIVAIGIWLLNCDRMTVNGNSVKDLYPAGSFFSYGIRESWMNLNGASLTFESFVVDGNNVSGADGNMAYGIFREVVAGTVTPSGQTIVRGHVTSDNVVEYTEGGHIYTRIGAAQSFRSDTVSGNTLAVLTGGLGTEAFIDYELQLDAYRLAGVKVTGNNVWWGATAAAARGIRVLASNMLSIGVQLKDIAITDNTLDGSDDSLGGTVAGGIGVHIDTAAIFGGLRTVQISNNQIRQMANRAIDIEIAASTPVQDMLIEGNTLDDFGLYGIYYDAQEQTDTLTIRGNSLRAQNAATPASVRGMWLYFGDDASTGTAAENVVIDGNTLGDIGTTGIDIDVNGSSFNLGELNNFRVCDNQFDEVGYQNDVAVLRVRSKNPCNNWSVSGNKFRNCGFNGGSYPTMHLMFAGDGQYYTEISVNDNILKGDRVGGILVIFEDGADDAASMTDLQVCRNMVTDPGAGATKGALVVDLADMNTASRIHIDGNITKGSKQAGVELVGSGLVTSLNDVSVSENTVDGSALSGVLVNAANKSGAVTNGVRLCRNSIRDAALTGVNFQAVDSSGVGGIPTRAFTVNDVLMEGNIVEGCTGHGLRFHYNVTPWTTRVKGVTIANNLSRINGAYGSDGATRNGGRHGLSIRTTGYIENLIVASNILQDNLGYGFYMDTSDGTNENTGGGSGFPTGYVESPVFTGNIARGNGSTPENVGALNTAPNWPPTKGVNVGNVDEAGPVPGSGDGARWADIDAAGWMGAAAATPFTGSIQIP